MQNITQAPAQFAKDLKDSDWVGFPGGELEGKRPKALCPACREALQHRADGQPAPPRRALCFQCYRAEIDRDRALKAAGQLDTASTERFQTALPFEPVNRPRLEMLKAERSTARASMLATSSGKFADRRRQAQIAARHALQRIAQGLAGNSAQKLTSWRRCPRTRDGRCHPRRGAAASGIVASVRCLSLVLGSWCLVLSPSLVLGRPWCVVLGSPHGASRLGTMDPKDGLRTKN